MHKILVADDIASNRKLLRKILAKVNEYVVVEALDGSEAISLFQTESPDLVLMDVNMPNVNGYEAAAEIKAIAVDNYIPIIFVTALSVEASLSSALESGGDDFISKPIDATILESKICAHLRIRELNKQVIDKNSQLEKVNQNLEFEHELIEHFFENAIHQSFLDENIIRYHMSSMSAFNGDLLLTQRGPDGGLTLLMGDFTGHGLTAAMGTLPVALIFFSMVKRGSAIADIARELNLRLNELMPHGMFFSASLLALNTSGDILTVWMGGMPECYLLSTKGDLKFIIHSNHMPLGILADDEFEDGIDIFTVEENDKVYICSDGVTEAVGVDGTQFGDERLEKLLLSTSLNRFDEVLKELNLFTQTTSQNDDISFVEVTCVEIPAEKRDLVECDQPVLLPWSMTVPLTASDMREQDPVSTISEILGGVPALSAHKGILQLLLSEIYSNVLDYSILGMDSMSKIDEEQFVNYYRVRDENLQALLDASIDFSFQLKAIASDNYLAIQTIDSGKGYQGQHQPKSEDGLHGRGLDLIESLCEKVTFSEDGRTLDLLYRL